MSDAISPFRIEIPQSALDDLHARIDATRWPDGLPGAGWSHGVPPDYLRELAQHWRHTYDWREQERRLNGHDQFTTEIDGQRIHFLHVRSAKPDTLPILLTHGWPGSVVEFLDVIEPLSAEHDLVIPSLPGYGFSGPTTEAGWNTRRIAGAWAELMRRLGYSRYGAQGGDWGSMVTRDLMDVDPEHLAGAHVNMLFSDPPDDLAALSEQDRARLAAALRYRNELSGYSRLQATRPQSLAYALTDSPVGQLAWIVERFRDWTDSEAVPEDAVDRDLMLTNVMCYWLTGTAGSSARLYFEQTHGQRTPATTAVPLGVAVFPHDLILPVRSLVEREYQVTHWSEMDRGGHFAAMEEPDLFAEDVLAFFAGIS